jgi:glycosyltransferase involved in cell wall biosynthesis
MKLLIAIPALNEEDSIANIIQRTLDARQHILAHTPVTEVEVTVISDGSTDRTVERATAFGAAITLIVFERNRGYGAAIMEAWRRSDADLLSFLDADGTCDPRFFADLCRALIAQDAHVVLGCRMHRESRMPLLRRVGNTVFATMLTTFGSMRVRDAASGMRVVRRSCLPRLMPLPTGLHFTPAMSARAILADDLKIVEIDMSYQERAGRSKLHPFRDGLRFLRVILSAAFLYRPSRPLGILAVACFLSAGGWTLRLAWQLQQYGGLEDWMIYHFVVIQLSATAGVLLATAGYLGHKAVGITLSTDPARYRRRGLVGALLSHPAFWIVPFGLAALGSWAIAPAALDYFRTGLVDPATHHWSRFLAMSFSFSVAFVLAAARLVDITLDLLGDRLAYLKLQSLQGAQDGGAPR